MAQRSAFLDLVDERVVVYDGAFGTYMQEQNLTADDFGGPDLEGCNEILVLSRPDLVAGMHEAFFDVGVDVVETATFGAFAVPLNEYGVGDKTHEINLKAAQIRFADLRDAYETQVHGLLEGGVDLLLIETQFDLLGLKAAMIASRRAMAAVGRTVPMQVQVTMELTGRMLPGTEIGAALAAVDALHPDVFGLNCATGPSEMSEHLRHLSQHARM